MYTTPDHRKYIRPRSRNEFLWVAFGKERVLVCCPLEEAKREGVRAMWKCGKTWVVESHVTGIYQVNPKDYETLNEAARIQQC